jgi:hypothetical protein
MVTLGTKYILNQIFQKGDNIKLYVSLMYIHNEGAVNLEINKAQDFSYLKLLGNNRNSLEF